MPLEGQAELYSPHNISGAFFQTTEVNGDLAPCSLSGVIQFSSSPESPNWFETMSFTALNVQSRSYPHFWQGARFQLSSLAQISALKGLLFKYFKI